MDSSAPQAARLRTVGRAVADSGTGASCHEVRLYRHKGSGYAGTGALDAVLHCDFPPRMGVGEVHLRTEHVERTLRAGIPALEQVVIHAEPAAG